MAAPTYDPLLRDRAIAAYRHQVYAALGLALYPHQAEWQLATEGWTLLDAAPALGDHYVTVRVPDAADTTFYRESRAQHTLLVPRRIVPRPGGPAHHACNLAAYKAGKSWGGAAYLTGYAMTPDAHVQLIGAEYSISEPEFNYLVEFLCADSPRGMGMPYRQLALDARNGRMRLHLQTGALYECQSWENQKRLKGRKVDCYYYAEAFQLPGMICYNSISQNLREKRGRAIWTTTADEPWVVALHDRAHGSDPDWHCTCGVSGEANTHTFSLDAIVRDAPSLDLLPPAVLALAKQHHLKAGGMMTRERFAISWLGQIGTFVGRVYEGYQRGGRQFSPLTHPQLWRPDVTFDAVLEGR